MMALNRYRLKHLAAKGMRGAQRTSRLLAHTDQLLGVILLGNNLLNAGAATLSTIITVRLFGNDEVALSIATLLLTFLILVFSEVTPKVLGAAYSEQIAFPSSLILAPLLRLAYPIVWFVNLFVKALLWIFRLKPPSAESGHTLSMEELRTLVLEASYIPKKHQSILLNLFELEEITVDDVMVPRSKLEAVDIESPIEVLRSQIATSYHTRLPVYRDQFDNILGTIHVRRVLHQARNGELTKEAILDILREPYYVPVGTPIFTQLQHFQENQERLGLVVDEYGELQGLITLESILEEIVGEFTSFSPTHGGIYTPQPDGSWLVPGSSLLRDLNRKLGLDLPLDGPKTLNGLILEHLEDIPESGTSLKIAGHPIEIVQTLDRVVRVAKISGAAKPSEALTAPSS